MDLPSLVPSRDTDTGSENLGSPRRRVLSPEALIEIQQRRTYTLQGVLHPERKGKLFEHFVVTGLPPRLAISIDELPVTAPAPQTKASSTQTRSVNTISNTDIPRFNPEVLFCYPPSESVKKLLVPQFSFPEGISSNNVKRVTTDIEMNQIVFSPLSSVEESDSSFVFLLTAEDALLYGVCVVHEELLRDRLSFAETKGDDQAPTDVGFIVAPRCYLFLTKFPFFSTHFQVLYSILAQERTRRMFSKMALDMPAESEVLALLRQYHAFDVPSGEQSLNIQLSQETLNFVCPAGDDDEQLIDFCLAALLKLVPLDHILILLAGILQEYQVVLVSRQVSIISAVVMGIIPLMRPYVWQGTFIPVVPLSLEECIHSPMPYIMGIQCVAPESVEVLDDVLIWDIDAANFINLPAGIIPLPYVQSLHDKLETLHNTIYRSSDVRRRECYLQPYSNTAGEIDICNQVLLTLRHYHKDMHSVIKRAIDSIPRFNISKPRHLTKLVVAVGDDHYSPFLKRFVGTQHWHFFYHNVQLDDDSIFYVTRAAKRLSRNVELPQVADDQSDDEASPSTALHADPSPSIHRLRSESMSSIHELDADSTGVVAAINDAFSPSDDEGDS